jgi:hypothetical protein
MCMPSVCTDLLNPSLPNRYIYWVLNGLLFRLRSVKMEQRKLNDQANSLVDLAKVSWTDKRHIFQFILVVKFGCAFGLISI